MSGMSLRQSLAAERTFLCRKYIKKDMKQLNIMFKDIKGKIALQILGKYLELLINQEWSDLKFLLILLKSENLVMKEKCEKLKIISKSKH